jgi:murein DD-endopeptidase MepM/ murein hydrolase activator NlpD
VTKDGAIVSTENPSADKDVEKIAEASEQGISVYVVRPGDSLSEIADMFEVSVATIRGFNNIRKDSDLKPGMELLILPIDGISYKVVKGDTLESVAKKFSQKGDEVSLIASDIILFNDIPENGALVVGTEIIIPNASSDVPSHEIPSASKPKPATNAPSKGGKGYFVKAWTGPVTQGFHDTYRAKDYGMPIGTKVGASAAGTIMVAREGWNGGYGNFVIMKHPNGAQTLYAHLSKISVSVGQTVAQRETIGLSGSTGRSTGPHLHFEIRHWGDIPF